MSWPLWASERETDKPVGRGMGQEGILPLGHVACRRVGGSSPTPHGRGGVERGGGVLMPPTCVNQV